MYRVIYQTIASYRFDLSHIIPEHIKIDSVIETNKNHIKVVKALNE